MGDTDCVCDVCVTFLYPRSYPPHVMQDVDSLVGGVLVEVFHSFMNRLETFRAVEWDQLGTVWADHHLPVSIY